ncbi:hypothetical protein LTR37_001932 [Vermiconidia calcicola]|uniref:Uncharacterized protein n=1 Tax=Vermiconidia calcicola TaxID=1690605 RepID=A0ACC3NUG9_9PEZI|nr:hypothetical protein LTR37_001932 [Vermiconidia calcicola]
MGFKLHPSGPNKFVQEALFIWPSACRQICLSTTSPLPPNLDHFYKRNASPFEENGLSSATSYDSIKKPADRDYAESTTSLSDRPASMVPSYMNAWVPARKPIVPRRGLRAVNGDLEIVHAADLPATPPPPPAKGLLLLVIAALPHPATISYIEMMLKGGSYSELTVIGHVEQETELKQVKMSVYALLGKLSLEVGVHLELQKSWNESEISTAVSKASRAGDPIHGVLCSPAYDGNISQGSDILALDESEFQRPWTYSVGFLHSLAKATLPHMWENGHIQRGKSGFFLITPPTESSAASSVYKAACDRLVDLIAEANASSELTVAYADTVLIPEPEPVRTNGTPSLPIPTRTKDPDDYEFSGQESPTKLWNLWALQDGLGAD